MALVDYRLEQYVALWNAILANESNANTFKALNRVRFDQTKEARKAVATYNLPAGFPKIGIYYGAGSDSGWSSRYGTSYDPGQAVDVQQVYRVRLTFEKPEIVVASPLIASVRGAILAAGPRLGGASAGVPYVRLSSVANANTNIGPDEDTGGTNRLVTEFDVTILSVLTIEQLTGA